MEICPPKAIATEDCINKIVALMKCEECQNYLCSPVKYNIETFETICGRCSDKYEPDSVNLKDSTYLNKIGELLHFPCFYHKFGCKEICTWNEAQIHESACPFRQYTCPSIPQTCTFKGSPSNLRKHYVEMHKMLTGSIPLEMSDDNKNYLVESMGELFIFQMKCDITADMLYFDVRFLGPPQRAARFHFKIELSIPEQNASNDKNLKYIERKQVEPDDTWEINECSSLAVRTGMVKAMLKNSDDILLTLKLDVRKPLYNGKADQALMQEVECPVCKDHMIRPIRMCLAGHSMCDNCFQKLNNCPTCRGGLGETRNISLETLSDQMHYRCMYFDEGCEFTDVPLKIKDHEMTCDVSYYDCPLKQLVNCKWRGKLGDVCIHASKEHQFKF